MADIKLLLQNYGGHDDDDQEDELHEDLNQYFDGMDLDGRDRTNPDDLLTPLEKLRKYCTSENIFTRQMVARSIVETVQSITNEQECLSLLDIISKLSDDIEPSVRCELMEQLPPCCMMLMDLSLVPDALSGFVLPVMVKYLTDPNNQVRKLSQNALLQLMDQDLIHRDDVETQICPVLLQLTEPDSGDDFRTEAVALMTKITPLIGGEVTEKLFLKRFGDLCTDPLFHVRKVCASNFGDITSVISTETTEMYLLPLFARLCEDGVWGVRKACAETFMAVSSTCSRDIKYEKLAPLFVGLLCDKSRWVQMAAYQALGQFIATFADPRRTGFDVNEDGNLIHANTTFPYEDLCTSNISETQTRGETSDLHNSSTSDEVPPTPLENTNEESVSEPDDPSRNFTNFEFWRTPLPDVEIPDELLGPVSSTENTSSQNLNKDNDHTSDSIQNSLEYNDNNNSTIKTLPDVTTEETSVGSERSDIIQSFVQIHVENLQSDGDKTDQVNPTQSNYEYDRSVSPQSSAIRHGNDTLFEMNPGSDDNSDDEDSHAHSTSHYASSLVDEESLNNQKIVPPALLEHYISMTEPNKAQTIDGELPRHCAFTLPGVVLALGRNNWHLIKETYDLLSTDMQWKVRRTLAFSIHDLATILGQDICVADLVPIFNGFLKDLDEVRIGVLKHLFDFINILPVDLQKDYLNLFNEFLKTDNTRNWRFRQDLAHQLMSLVNLYDVEELAEFFCPVSLELVCDKVAEVRDYAFHLLCILMQKLCNHNNNGLVHKFATNIITLGTHHQHWVKRKACAQVYQRFLEGNWYDPVRFSKDFLPSLINLCTDVVPNVRLISSKALLAYTRTQYYQNLDEQEESRILVERTLESLQSDDDQDVRYFSGGKVEDKISQRNTRILGDELHQYHDGVRIIQSGIYEYSMGDNQGDDDDDTELVEEVYIEENGNDSDEIVVEEYYVDKVFDSYDGQNTGTLSEPGDVYVEEIIEEVIELGMTPAS